MQRKTIKPRVLFISSTGGHLTELLALKSLFKKYDFFIVTENTLTAKSVVKPYRKKAGFLIFGTSEHRFSYPFMLLGNCFISLYYYLKFRPQVIVTTGAHTAGPMCSIGKILGSKIIYIESFANIVKKSTSGKMIYPFADLFLVQWKSMLKLYPNAIYGGWIF